MQVAYYTLSTNTTAHPILESTVKHLCIVICLVHLVWCMGWRRGMNINEGQLILCDPTYNHRYTKRRDWKRKLDHVILYTVVQYKRRYAFDV